MGAFDAGGVFVRSHLEGGGIYEGVERGPERGASIEAAWERG